MFYSCQVTFSDYAEGGLSATDCIVQPLFAEPVAAYAPGLPAAMSSIRLSSNVDRAKKPEPAVHDQSATQ